MHFRGDLLRQSSDARAHGRIVADRDGRARFLHSPLSTDPGLSRRVDVAGGQLYRIGNLQPFLELAERDGRPGDGRVGVALRPRLAVGCLADRFEGALIRVDRPRQRQAVVALLYRFVRLLHRGGGCGERLRCVLLRAGSARGIDSALGAIDFFLGSFGAAGENEERADRDSDAAAHRPAV